MANWVLNKQGKVIPRRSLCRLTKDERSQSNEVEAAKRAAFNADITSKLGDSIKLPTTPLPDTEEPNWNAEPYGEDKTETPEPFEADLVDAAGKPIMMHSLTDALSMPKCSCPKMMQLQLQGLSVGLLIPVEK